MLEAVVWRGRVPIARGIPVRAGERHRRLPADARSPLSIVVLGAVNRFQLQGVEWTGRRLHPGGRDAQVAGRGLDVGMAQQHLDSAKISAGFQHVRSATVS